MNQALYAHMNNKRKMKKKLEKSAEQVLPGSEGVGGRGRGPEGRGEKWPQKCMNI
jgi:hypothetical protein